MRSRAGDDPLASESSVTPFDLAAAGPCLGIVEWRHRVLADGMQLECETTFFDPGLTTARPRAEPAARVLHVERLTELGPRLIWRELTDGPGRCLRAEWSRDGTGLVTRDFGLHDSSEEVLSTASGAVMPLYLLELARTGRVTTGVFLRFDPLVAALDPIEICTRYESAALRVVEQWRPDGTLAGRFVFRGIELTAFQCQDGDVWARRITAGEYEQRACPSATVDLER
ncbi:MAG: hypothetical protein ACKVWV_04060 [Planctomycetota bacterium]